MRNIGASVMHRSECLAKGGFKTNNGPSTKDKGPMTSKEISDTSNETSLPQPTQAGRIDACMELIVQAMKCLENNDKDCVMKLIEELIKADCHNGYAVGKKIADGVKELVHGLWLASNREEICGLLRMLKNLNVSKGWVRKALGMSTKMLNKRIAKCGIDWEGKITRNNVIKVIENMLRKMGWNEIKMCEELLRFIGVDVDEFRRYGIEPCVWLNGLELLSDLRRPYWLGMAKSDLVTWKYNGGIRLELGTTNTIDVIFFAMTLSAIKTSSLKIVWGRGVPSMKYVSEPINLSYYVYLSADAWPWPIELSAGELERILDGFNDEGLAEYIAGEIDGDGIVWYNYGNIFVRIVACRDCPKRMVLDVLKEVIARRFGIVGTIYHFETADALEFGGEKAARLLRRIVKYIHHPLKKLRAELILALYDGRISPEKFEELYDVTKYERRAPDIKRNNGLDVLVRAVPQTHTHGEPNTKTKTENTK